MRQSHPEALRERTRCVRSWVIRHLCPLAPSWAHPRLTNTSNTDARIGHSLQPGKAVLTGGRPFPAQPAPINFDNITRAIAAFQRTLISRDSPYDRFAAGDRNALSPEARQGLALFTGERAKCSQCHQPPHFTDQRFHNTGLYNADGTGDLPGTDKGLANETGQTADTGRFRTPTLRNITVTAPYMRDGSITSLGDVIAHYAAGGQAAVGAKPSPRRSPLVAGFKISEAEKRHLLRFLESLTDERFLTKPELQTPFR